MLPAPVFCHSSGLPGLGAVSIPCLEAQTYLWMLLCRTLLRLCQNGTWVYGEDQHLLSKAETDTGLCQCQDDWPISWSWVSSLCMSINIKILPAMNELAKACNCKSEFDESVYVAGELVETVNWVVGGWGGCHVIRVWGENLFQSSWPFFGKQQQYTCYW